MGLLEIRELSVRLPAGRGLRPILDGISLDVAAGEAVGVVGESGSGKSVTLRAVLGLLPRGAQAEGRILVEGADVLAMSGPQLRRLRAETAAMVFQDPRASINPLRRIGDFLTEGLRVNLGQSAPRARAAAVELLAAVGIREPERALRRWPHEFSGGMLQRVMIAAALAGDPSVLLADEPTTALDVTTQAEVIAILRRLQLERGMGMLFVTHDLELAAAICDRIYVLYAGRIMEMQAAAALFAAPRHPYTAGLLASTPKLEALDGEPGRLAAIAGRPISLAETPPGCPFAPRCPHVQPRCRQEPVPLLQLPGPAGAARVACVRAEELQLAPATGGVG